MNATYMKTRWQPVRWAHKIRLESCGQTKKPKKCKIHSELRPILSGSASSSTVARPSGLSMDNIHQWSEEEELALFEEVETLLKTQTYSKKSTRNAELSVRLNAHFPGVAVRFTASTIKNKLVLFKGRWLGRRKLTTCKGTPIICSSDVLDILFAETSSASESTNSGAADAGAADSMNVNYGIKQNKGIYVCSIKDCIELVESIEEPSNQEKADATNIMKVEVINREIFMNFKNPEVRLLWIKREIAKQLKDHRVEDQRTA